MRYFFHSTSERPVRSRICVTALAMTAMIFSGSAQLSAQTACDSTGTARETELVGTGADYARLTELDSTGRITPRMARRLSNSMLDGCTSGPWKSSVRYVRELARGLNVIPLSSFVTYNSKYPEDRNNGALWNGRGSAGSLEGGVLLRAGRLSAALLPLITYQSNQSYETLPAGPGFSTHASGMYFGGLDAPQRFGPKAYSTFDLGQSYIRLDAGKLGLGFSKENVWWGPGISNAILFTNTAPGFPHVFLNVARPLNVGIGKLSGEAIWGRLSESKYFDTVDTNNHRMIVGGLITLEPKGLSGLYLSFGRTFVLPWDSVSAGDLFPLIQPFLKENLVTSANPSANNEEDDQRLSLMARYVLPQSGFELYGEFAREDASWNTTDLIGEPEHSSARVLGLQKLFKPRETRWVRAYLEATNLQVLRQSREQIRATPALYVHNPQGHTQMGQLLGASIGPGAESQLLGVDILGLNGLLGFYLERVRRDELSARAQQLQNTSFPPRHDVAVTGGVRFTKAFGGVRLDSEFALSRRHNRNFIRDESNSRAVLRVTWDGSVRRKQSQPAVPSAVPQSDTTARFTPSLAANLARTLNK